MSAYRTLSKQYAQLGPLVEKFEQFRKARTIAGTRGSSWPPPTTPR
jgi:hypothetical protein